MSVMLPRYRLPIGNHLPEIRRAHKNVSDPQSSGLYLSLDSLDRCECCISGSAFSCGSSISAKEATTRPYDIRNGRR